MSDSTPFLSHHAPQCPAWLLESAATAAPFVMGVVGANSLVAMETARDAYVAGLAIPHLIGDNAVIRKLANELDWDITKIAITHASGEDSIVTTATELVQDGTIQALMKGHVHTDRFMAGIIKRSSGIRGDKRLVHIFALFPYNGGKPLLLADGAVNVAPDFATRQVMLREMVRVAQILGRNRPRPRPRIAIISATETPIASVPDSLAAEELAAWGRTHLPQADISGPLSLDLALSPQAVAIKGLKDDAVAGLSDGLIMPDLTTGNVLFKALVWFKGACAAGVVIGGNVPIMLTSRADSAAARLASVALGAKLYSHSGA